MIGFDIGSLYVKVVNENGRFSYPAVTAIPGSNEIDIEEEDILKNLSIIYKDKVYYLGERAYNTTNAKPNFTGDKNNLQGQLHFMATMALCGDKSPSVVAGLSVGDFNNLKNNTKMALSQEYKYIFQGSSHTLKAREVKIIPQGTGAYYDYILKGEATDKSDIDKEKAAKTILVIDIGYRTTDLVVMTMGKYDNTKTAPLFKGVSTIYEEIRRSLLTQFNLQKNPVEIDTIAKQCFIRLKGEEIDISDIINEASNNVSQSIIEQARLLVPDEREIDEVLLVGGGSYLTNPFFKHEYPIIDIEEPEFANARGYFKYGRIFCNNNI